MTSGVKAALAFLPKAKPEFGKPMSPNQPPDRGFGEALRAAKSGKHEPAGHDMANKPAAEGPQHWTRFGTRLDAAIDRTGNTTRMPAFFEPPAESASEPDEADDDAVASKDTGDDRKGAERSDWPKAFDRLPEFRPLAVQAAAGNASDLPPAEEAPPVAASQGDAVSDMPTAGRKDERVITATAPSARKDAAPGANGANAGNAASITPKPSTAAPGAAKPSLADTSAAATSEPAPAHASEPAAHTLAPPASAPEPRTRAPEASSHAPEPVTHAAEPSTRTPDLAVRTPVTTKPPARAPEPQPRFVVLERPAVVAPEHAAATKIAKEFSPLDRPVAPATGPTAANPTPTPNPLAQPERAAAPAPVARNPQTQPKQTASDGHGRSAGTTGESAAADHSAQPGTDHATVAQRPAADRSEIDRPVATVAEAGPDRPEPRLPDARKAAIGPTVPQEQRSATPMPTPIALLAEKIAADIGPLKAATKASLDAIHAQTASSSAHSLKIQLHPAELGIVTANLRFVGEQLSIELQVESRDAYERLSSDSETIVKSLRAIGLDVDRVTVLQPSIATTAPTRSEAAAQTPGQAPRGGEQFGYGATGGGSGGTGGQRSGGDGNDARHTGQGPTQTQRDGTGGGLYI